MSSLRRNPAAAFVHRPAAPGPGARPDAQFPVCQLQKMCKSISTPGTNSDPGYGKSWITLGHTNGSVHGQSVLGEVRFIPVLK
jgi:hypothetical protein